MKALKIIIAVIATAVLWLALAKFLVGLLIASHVIAGLLVPLVLIGYAIYKALNELF